ncbi:MAG: family 2 glycosyl transferase, partial [Acidobacteria bacterium]
MTDRFPTLLAALGLVIGSAAALFYSQQGLTLSHYDAKAHLVVARRVLDSLTPEYSQIGAVWLPLPHLLNLLPVQIDWFYRTGASGVAISVLSFALAWYAIARLVVRVTGSRVAAAIGVAMFALNPNVLYLQSTPMTE